MSSSSKPLPTSFDFAQDRLWTLYDIIVPLVGKAVVANAYQVKLIAAARVKTDKSAVWSLARLLVAGLIPEVWVPPVHVRELRALISHRRRLIQVRMRARNRLHSLTHRHNLIPARGSLFAPKQRDWWLSQDLSPTESLRLRHDLETLHHVDGQLGTVDDELNRLTTIEPWARFYPYLVQLPSFGLVVSMTVLAAIGDITRFPSAKHLFGYAGLGASIHDSGKTHRTGRITKQGRRDLRCVLVQAAWVAVNTHPHRIHFMLRAAVLHSLLRRLQRFSTISHPIALVACYVASWQLPRLDFRQLAHDSSSGHTMRC
jgi:transposase